LGYSDIRLLPSGDANALAGLASRALGFHYRVHPQRLALVSRRLSTGAFPWPLPWGSFPFDDINPGDHRDGLPLRHPPLSAFLTLSAVSSRPDLAALFHAAAALGISAFSVFPTSQAAAPLGARCPLAVARATHAAFARLRGFAPGWRPFPRVGCYASPRVVTLLAFPLSEVFRSSFGAEAHPLSRLLPSSCVPEDSPSFVRGASGNPPSRVACDNRRPTRESVQPP
jgi:hypothetical protein